MSIPATIKRHLARYPADYKVRTCRPEESMIKTAVAARVPLPALARAVLLKAGSTRLLAVLPASHRLDLEALNTMFKRQFELCTINDVLEQFGDCRPDALPPFGPAYGVKTIVDAALDKAPEIFFLAGEPGHFVRAQRPDFDRLMQDAWRGRSFSASAAKPKAVEEDTDDIRRRIEKVTNLPPMPGIAAEIIRLRNNPYSNASELAAVIEQDPSLSAQLLRYAGSPFYGYQGKLDSVEQAIVRVLGMDFVMDFAFGLALGKPFRNPKEGPLGLDAFWNHAIHTATLSQALCNVIDYSVRPAPGVAYLAGLLHNFGFLLLGHLFRPQFDRLNKAMEAEPQRPIIELEREVIGVTHTELGLWLMEAWDMPREIIETVREHHNVAYRGDYSGYANLVYVANALLARHGIGDAEAVAIPQSLYEAFGLNEADAEAALASVMADREGLDFMARRMAA